MNAVAQSDLWRSRLDVPNYEVWEAARYAQISPSTVGRWHKNTTLGDREPGSKLSYLQLIELAVAAACKKEGMKLAAIREARAYFADAYKTDHPFATLRLATDGVDLAEVAGPDMLIGNQRGQKAWKSIIGKRFKEFEYDDGLASRWHVAGVKSPIVIDPRVRFGAPHISGIPTYLLRDRWRTGEPIDEIKDDFGLKAAQIKAALRFEGIDPSAARENEWLH